MKKIIKRFKGVGLELTPKDLEVLGFKEGDIVDISDLVKIRGKNGLKQ